MNDRWSFCEIPVDWKNLMDNYLEGYHVPVGHPGLQRLLDAGAILLGRQDWLHGRRRLL